MALLTWGVNVTRSERYICIYSESTLSDEQRCADASKPDKFQLIAERKPDFKYLADHLGGRWGDSQNQLERPN